MREEASFFDRINNIPLSDRQSPYSFNRFSEHIPRHTLLVIARFHLGVGLYPIPFSSFDAAVIRISTHE